MRMMPNEKLEVSKFLVNLLRCELVTMDNNSECSNCTRMVKFRFSDFTDDDDDQIAEQGGYVVELEDEKSCGLVTIELVEQRLVCLD